MLLMLFVVLVNYFLGLFFQGCGGKNRKLVLIVGLVLNLAPLLFYKYSVFLLSVVGIDVNRSIHLPIGISFFTFQAISYLVDTYRQTTVPQKNIINLGLYISLFPQLIAGPIVRYHDISKQLLKRRIDIENFSYGVERFILGLGKKVLLANPLGYMADIAFSVPGDQLSLGAAWLGAVCYSLQIFYDFSGYSDMAIGLGRMFGFTFLENFNFPYISRSIQEFWRRWHISLSNWFRDYLYIPLGGNRCSPFRTVINLFTVFLLCGLWHGASWNFIIWGILHGFFLAGERGRFGEVIRNLPALFQHLYVVLVVIVGWVFFRAETFSQAVEYLGNMFGMSSVDSMYFSMVYKCDTLFVCTLSMAVVFLFPQVIKLLPKSDMIDYSGPLTTCFAYGGKILILTFILILSISALATDTYNPFIYYRF